MSSLMQRSDFMTALGLSLLRLAVAAGAIVDLRLLCTCPDWAVVPLLCLCGLCVAGLFTRGAALIVAIGIGVAVTTVDGIARMHLGADLLADGALALSGAGPWSIDALLHGRKIIHIDPDREEHDGPSEYPEG